MGAGQTPTSQVTCLISFSARPSTLLPSSRIIFLTISFPAHPARSQYQPLFPGTPLQSAPRPLSLLPPSVLPAEVYRDTEGLPYLVMGILSHHSFNLSIDLYQLNRCFGLTDLGDYLLLKGDNLFITSWARNMASSILLSGISLAPVRPSL